MFILNKYKRVLTSIYRNLLRSLLTPQILEFTTFVPHSANTTIYYVRSSLSKYHNNLRWALRIYPLRLFTHTSPTYFD